MEQFPLLCRIGRAPDPLEFAPYEFCGNGRFDDPLLTAGHLGPYFRTLYCGRTWLTCFLEILQGFRPDLAYLAHIASLPDGDDDPSLPSDEQIARDARTVSVSWLGKKAKQMLIVDAASIGPDLSKMETRERLRRELLDELVALGVRDIDLSAVTSGNRALTKSIARYLYKEMKGQGAFLYTSRFGCEHTCVSIFEGTPFRASDSPRSITLDDPDMAEALRLFDLVLQSS